MIGKDGEQQKTRLQVKGIGNWANKEEFVTILGG
jgi:hypothetical protein